MRCSRPHCRSRPCPVPPHTVLSSPRRRPNGPCPRCDRHGTVIPWARTLLAALPLLLLLLAAAWLLRGLLPADPALALATREGPDAPAAAEPPPDPKPALKAAFSSEEVARPRPEDRAGADRGGAQEAHRRLQAAGSAQAAAPGRLGTAAGGATAEARAHAGTSACTAAAAGPAQR